MASEPHSLESFDALPDDGARDAAIARAVGWEPPLPSPPAVGNSRCWWRPQQGGHAAQRACECQPYYTGGDADPFANWGLLAEVWKALGVGMSMAGPLLIAPPWTVAAGGLVSVDASTPHRAACRALVTAGLVPREEAPDAHDAQK